MKKLLKIGLTGGIGSGKTTISKIFQTLGIPIFNADHHSKKILNNNTKVRNDIVVAFGDSILNKNQIDNKKLAKIAFQNKKKLTVLNSIIHPYVIRDFNRWILKQNTNYIIKESAILFESKTHKQLDKIIVIKAPIKLRIQRIVNRDNRSVSEIKKIMNHQQKTHEISKYADYIVNNNEKKLLTPQIIKIHNTLSNL